MSEEQKNIHCVECAVRCSSVLKNCSLECLELISASKKVTAFQKGYRIITEGNSSQRIYFVKSGKIKIYKSDKDGRELIMRFAKSGDIIGFGDLDSVNENEVSAMAIADTVLCYIDHKIFLQLIRLYPEFALELLRFYKSELRDAELKSLKLVRLHVPGKVADALLTISDVYGCNGKDHSLNLMLSRQDIANLAGTTKEQVSKVLTDFCYEGFIRTEGKRIDLVNTDALRALTEV